MSTSIEMSPDFAAAFRGEFITHIARQQKRPRRKWAFTIGASIALVAVTGAGVATAAILGLPGSPVDTPLSEQISVDGAGAGEVALGNPPDGATSVAVEFNCQDTGGFTIATVQVFCTANDLGSATTFELPLSDVTAAKIPVDTADSNRWHIAAAYVNTVTSPWAVNERGQTYGVDNDAGSPDLVAVETTTGKTGYAVSADLDLAVGDPDALGFTSPEDALRWQQEVAGTSVTIPVYESDGTTRIGDFVIQR